MDGPQKVPILDLTYLARLGFESDGRRYSRLLGEVEIRVDHETGQGVLNTQGTKTPVKFITVTHLKWFMDAFK